MLSTLHIENIAIIHRLDLDFRRGFTVLTGETGAGKSIIIDSILLLLGNKASKDLIRSGCDCGIVSAGFCSLNEEAISILHENGLSPDEEGNVTIYRKIGIDGRNTARINGIAVTVTVLKQLGEHLINIHGQHDGVLLMDSKRHLGYLDEFGGISLEEYTTRYLRVKALQNELRTLKETEVQKNARKEQLTSWLEELEQCAPKEGEYDDLLLRRKNMMRNAEIIEALHTASETLYDGEISASQLIHGAVEAVEGIAKILPNGEEYLRRLSQLSAEIDDLGVDLGKHFDAYHSDQMDPNEIESRLDQLEEIKIRFGPSDREVLACWEKYKQELVALDENENILQKKEEEFSLARAELENTASALTQCRKKAAAKMEKVLQQELAYLDMPKVRFVVSLTQRSNERGGIRYRADGKDDVEFFLSANQGEEPRPLAKIASGGELSRIMLSMKNVLNQGIDTVIFDEVDTGVSGGTADKIGRKLAAGAEERQVLCITHLALIAARATHHLKVTKQEADGHVSSCVTELNHEERIKEIARIMGGTDLTDTILKSAEEMLKNSKNNS